MKRNFFHIHAASYFCWFDVGNCFKDIISLDEIESEKVNTTNGKLN